MIGLCGWCHVGSASFLIVRHVWPCHHFYWNIRSYIQDENLTVAETHESALCHGSLFPIKLSTVTFWMRPSFNIMRFFSESEISACKWEWMRQPLTWDELVDISTKETPTEFNKNPSLDLRDDVVRSERWLKISELLQMSEAESPSIAPSRTVFIFIYSCGTNIGGAPQH